jgi:microtubule-associated protein 1
LDEGQEIVSNLRQLSLIPQVCYRDSEPINLYHKVGHGTLDMYVLSPAKDSKEVREFLQKWNNNDQKLFANQKTSKDFVFPLQNLASVCALLVWQPANPEDTITRILFPGSSPQNKIFEGLDRIKSLEFIKHPVCSEKSLAPTTIIKTKQSMLEKIIQPEKKIPVDNKKDKTPKPQTDNIMETEMKNGEVNGVQPEKVAPVKKSDSTESEKSISKPKKIIENGEKIEKPRPKLRTELRPKARSDSQQRKVKTAEKKPSPTTPKKQVNGEPRMKPKASPTATPAKSAKDANNRKVVESKIKAAPKKEPAKPIVEKKEVKTERKPISRRPKDISKLSGSPAKKVNGVQKPDSISRRGKLDKEGTTDSSTVSTPSADQDSILKKDISKLTTDEIQNLKAQELADLKEEQEAVKEIEAVFRKGELHEDKPSDFRKIKDLSIDDKLENEEYLIIEKTEIEQDLGNETNKEERNAEDRSRQ